jgi:ABC-type transporter Mla MlaB component
MEIQQQGDTLYFTPKTNLIADKIETLRDEFVKGLNKNPTAVTVVLNASYVETVDSLGVNLLIGLYRQVSSESRIFKIEQAGDAFLKLAGFFQLTKIFTISGREE